MRRLEAHATECSAAFCMPYITCFKQESLFVTQETESYMFIPYPEKKEMIVNIGHQKGKMWRSHISQYNFVNLLSHFLKYAKNSNEH